MLEEIKNKINRLRKESIDLSYACKKEKRNTDQQREKKKKRTISCYFS